MSEIVTLSSSLNPKISLLVPRQISSLFSQSRNYKFVSFPEKIGLVAERIRAVDAQKQDDILQELDDSLVSIELRPIYSETYFDQVMEEAHKIIESVVIVWMAAWCRKCIYLKPKLEKLAAEYYPRLFCSMLCSDPKFDSHCFKDILDEVIAAGKVKSSKAYEKWAKKISKSKPPTSPSRKRQK